MGRLIVDLGVDGKARISTWPAGDAAPRAAAEQDLVWPLPAEVLEDLRWYLEDYLSAPYGVYEDHGSEIQRKLKRWGEAIFTAVFGSGPARDAYAGMTAAGSTPDVIVRSGSPALLALPWELIRDPARSTPLALDLGGVSRAINGGDLASGIDVPGGKLRVLMAISRPLGPRDIGYQMIARPLIARLAAVRGDVDLVVLRPPTLDALAGTLASARRAGEPFQVVHFDGHGRLGGPGRPADESVLVFEGPRGGTHYVPTSRVAQVLSAAAVPVVVLNACQSGAIGKNLEAAIATRLLQEGVASVVAMAYTVYAVAAAEFMAAFYESLFAGAPVSAAVSGGRRQMARNNHRPSPKGDLPLDDWLVPVHYSRADVRFPGTRKERAESESLEAALNAIRFREAAPPPSDDLDPVGEFIGRDRLFYTLEMATRQPKVIIPHGPGGTGKTELAKAFGRWWRDSAGVESPDWVFFHSFEPGQATFGLDGLVNEIGLRVKGPDFARMEPTARQAAVEEFLTTHRALLILDNFETVHSMPDEATQASALAGSGELALVTFLATLAEGAGGSAVLITSRSPEGWLAERYLRLPVPGLTRLEANQYASYLLAAHPVAEGRRADRAFADLMQWLDGHPFAMRLILPHLDEESAGYDQAVDAANRALTLSYAGFSEWLHTHIESGNAPVAYKMIELQRGNLTRLLTFALTDRMWNEADRIIIPLTSYFEVRGMAGEIAAWLERVRAAVEDPPGVAPDRGTDAWPLWWRLIGLQGRQQRDSSQWTAAEETFRLMATTLESFPPQPTREAHLVNVYRQLGIIARAGGRLAEARDWHDKSIAAAEAAGDKLHLATAYFDAAIQARNDGRLEEAEDLCIKSAGLAEELNNMTGMAATYHELGLLAEERNRLQAAMQWYGKSLAVESRLGNKPGLATSYAALARTAWMTGQLDAAEDWYQKALAIDEELGNAHPMVDAYHQLGIIAQDRGRLADAEDWYNKAIMIAEGIGYDLGIGHACGQLGVLAAQRGLFQAALEWTVRGVSRFGTFPHPSLSMESRNLAALAAALGSHALEETWVRVTGGPLPDAVREYVQTASRG